MPDYEYAYQINILYSVFTYNLNRIVEWRSTELIKEGDFKSIVEHEKKYFIQEVSNRLEKIKESNSRYIAKKIMSDYLEKVEKECER